MKGPIAKGAARGEDIIWAARQHRPTGNVRGPKGRQNRASPCALCVLLWQKSAFFSRISCFRWFKLPGCFPHVSVSRRLNQSLVTSSATHVRRRQGGGKKCPMSKAQSLKSKAVMNGMTCHPGLKAATCHRTPKGGGQGGRDEL